MDEQINRSAKPVQQDAGKNNGINANKLQKKWGVSKDELDEAVRHVGENRSRVEEFLVNKKWQNTSGSS